MDLRSEPKSKSETPQHLLVRIVLLSVFIILVNSWARAHLGADSLWTLAVTGLLAVLGVAGSLARVLKKDEASGLREGMRPALLFFLQTRVLSFLYLALAIVGSFTSSVLVIPSDSSESIKVSLWSEFGQEDPNESWLISGSADLRPKIQLTTPFGRPFSLKVDGYLPYSFDLYPWLGKRVRVASDLQASPSILIRVPSGSARWREGGTIKVLYKGHAIAECPTTDSKCSVMVGPRQAVPSEFIERWMRELLAQGVTDQPLNRCLLLWQEPVWTEPSVPLMPGMVIDVEFSVKNEEPLARATVYVGTEKVQDVILLEESRQ